MAQVKLHYIGKEDSMVIQSELSGYVAKLKVKGILDVCFITNHKDVHTIEELVRCFGYTPADLSGKRIVISIEDYEQEPCKCQNQEANKYCSECGILLTH